MRRYCLWLSVCLSILATTPTRTTSTCPPPSSPINTRVTVSGDTATYTCDPGYTLFGSSTIPCKDGKWQGEQPICATNIAYKRPASLSSVSRGSDPGKANDGHVTFLHEGQQCAVTSKEGSPWWQVDLLQVYQVVVVRVATRACCDVPALQNLEIRVGNSTDLQKNRLCAWLPGTVEEGVVKEFKCALPIRGRYVAVQMVGSEAVLSLCEVEVFSTEEFAKERCSPDADLNSLGIFNKTCYEFRVQDGSSFDAARAKCQQISSSSSSSPSDLAYGITEVTHNFLTSELDRRKTDLKADLVWIGVRKEPEFISRTWKWVDETVVDKPKWGRAQPNNYNGKQNCVALDRGKNWGWNDVGCELDYLPYVCQYLPRSCGSPNKAVNTTMDATEGQTGSQVTYSCPKDSVLVGNANRTCLSNGLWSGTAPTCKYIHCGPPPDVQNGHFTYTNGEERNTYMASITYTCASNYSLQGESVRVCTEEAVWAPDEKPTCLYSWCPTLTPPAHGEVKMRGQRSGDIAEFTCEEGYLLVGPKTVSCQLGGKWSDGTPTCKFIDCKIPPDLPNGRLTLVNHTTHLGSHVSYTCDPNHWLDGSEVRVCEEDGNWSDHDPACVLVTCGEPEVPNGAYVTGYSFQVGAKVTYYCDPGFRMVIAEVEGHQDVDNGVEDRGGVEVARGHELGPKSHIRMCEVTGLWSGPVPECVYTDCGHLPAPAKGSRDYLNSTTHLGSLVQYSCSPSYRIVGQDIRECTENGRWSGTTPLCQEVRCGPPPSDKKENGARILTVSGNDRRFSSVSVRGRKHDIMEDSYRIGSVVHYECTKGYVVTDGATRTCTANGTWSASVPTCTYVDCGLPEKVAKGAYRLLSNTTHFGSQISYQCAPDYKLDGRIRRHCLANGTWAGLSPTCVEIMCPDLAPALTPALEVHPHGRVKVGGIATYSCETGRSLVGGPVRKCGDTGNWNGSAPRCEWVSCQMPEEVKNGRTIRLNETLNYAAIVEIHCLPDHTLLGEFRRTCEENGEWSGPEPRCLAEDDDNNIYTLLDGNSIDNQARDSTTATTTSATNTGLYVGLVFGLLLCGIFVATLLFLRRRQRRGGGKVEAAGGGGGGGERPPLPPPNDVKNETSIAFSSITDPITGNNIYENIDDEEEEGGVGRGGEDDYYNYNNNYRNNNYANTTTTTTAAAATTTPPPAISHHSQPFYRPTTTITNSRRPKLPPPQPPTVPPAVVTINGVTVSSNSG